MELFRTPNRLDEKKKHIQKVVSFGKTNIVNIQLRAGEEIAEHDADADVAIIVRSGRVSFTVEGESVEVSAHNVLHMAPLEKHSLKAEGATDLILMKIKQ